MLGVSGGRSGILNESSLLSALARPHCGYFNSLEEKVAVLMEAVIQNHGFVDGNKRTAVFLSLAMILLSDHDIVPTYPAEDIDLQIENMAVALANGSTNTSEIIDWLKPRLKPL